MICASGSVVEYRLAKARVAGSNPVLCSGKKKDSIDDTVLFLFRSTAVLRGSNLLRFAPVRPKPRSTGPRAFSPAGSVSPRTNVPRTLWDVLRCILVKFFDASAHGPEVRSRLRFTTASASTDIHRMSWDILLFLCVKKLYPLVDSVL